MSGPIADMPVNVCRSCRTVFIEDDRMYREPERCPKCGNRPGDAQITGEEGTEWEE